MDSHHLTHALSLRARRPILALLLGLVAAVGTPLPAATQDGDATIILVRHAEKVDDSRDPELSAAGHERAALLAEMLADAGVTKIVSTDFIRTRDTVGPLAAELGLDVELYDPRDLPGTAADLKLWGGTTLVSGHSNTTPALVQALGGDPRDPIDESEYDRMYIVHITADGPVTTTLIRFGDLYGG
jgi:phosphohistidine phosphatase SixA